MRIGRIGCPGRSKDPSKVPSDGRGQISDSDRPKEERHRRLTTFTTAPDLRDDSRWRDQRRSVPNEETRKLNHRRIASFKRDERPRVEDDARLHAARRLLGCLTNRL